jgi:hypothetical protein
MDPIGQGRPRARASDRVTWFCFFGGGPAAILFLRSTRTEMSSKRSRDASGSRHSSETDKRIKVRIYFSLLSTRAARIRPLPHESVYSTWSIELN